MEKKLYELSIDPEIQGLLPPLRDSEMEMLEASLLKDGCLEPILVWGDTIIDGHVRYALCHKHGIPFSIHPMRFIDRNDAVLWAARHQMGQRNLSPFQRCELVAHLEPLIQADARKRQSCGKSLPGAEKGQTREIMARMAGVSHGNWDKVKFILEKADGETKRRLREGELSIHRVYITLKSLEQQFPKTVNPVLLYKNESPAIVTRINLRDVKTAVKDLIVDVAVGEPTKGEILDQLRTISEMIEKAGRSSS